MLDNQSPYLDGLRKSRLPVTIFFWLVKFTAAILIIKHVDYGAYIVVGYILYALESICSLQNLNQQESNCLFSNLQGGRSSEMVVLHDEIAALKDQISDMDLRVVEVEIKCEGEPIE